MSKTDDKPSRPPARLPAWVFTDMIWSKLSGTAAKAYSVLALHADKAGRCWPSVSTIGRLAGVHRGSVSRAIGELVKAGLVVIEHRGGSRTEGGRYTSTTYRLALRHSDAEAQSTIAPAHKNVGEAQSSVAPAHVNHSASATKPHHGTHPIEPHQETAAAGAAIGDVTLAGAGGEESRRQLDELCRWLDRIGWRSRTKPANRAKLITRDPDHALRCWEQYKAKAAELPDVRDPAALFDAIFTGKLKTDGGNPVARVTTSIAKRSGGGENRERRLRELRAQADQIKSTTP